MKLKTTNKLIIELASVFDKNKLLLAGVPENIGEVDGVFYSQLSDDNLFSKNFGEDCKFFYNASILCEKKCSISEVGLGYLESPNVLVRENPLYTLHDDSFHRAFGLISLDCQHDDEKLLVTSYLPSNIHELLYEDNCIITSNHPHCPSPLKIEKNSLLVRLNEEIQSIPIGNLSELNEFSQPIKDLLCNYTKQMVLKTSRLDVKRIYLDHLILNRSKKPVGKKGELFFDESDSKLKFYDGTEWKVFKYEDT